MYRELKDTCEGGLAKPRDLTLIHHVIMAQAWRAQVGEQIVVENLSELPVLHWIEEVE